MVNAEYPYLVRLLDANNDHMCSGTLIAPDLVLTAAHCSAAVSQVFASHNNKDVVYSLLESITHPNYYAQDYVDGFVDVDPYDAALLHLNGTLNPSAFLQLNTDVQIPKDYAEVTGIVWKSTTDLSDTLEEVSLEYIPNDVCILSTGDIVDEFTSSLIAINYSNQIIDVSFCAMPKDDKGPTVCTGNSGGPMLITRNATNSTSFQWMQAAIISASYGCRDPTLPLLNVRVSRVYSWIQEKVCQLSVTPPTSFDCQQWMDDNEINSAQLLQGTTVSLTIVIQADDYPTEIGYYIEAFDEWLNGNTVPVTQIAAVYPGSFGTELANTKIVQTINITASVDCFRFVMTDNESDGLFPGGWYKVWLGEQTSGTLIAHGASFFLEDATNFTLSPSTPPTARGSAAPSTTRGSAAPSTTRGSAAPSTIAPALQSTPSTPNSDGQITAPCAVKVQSEHPHIPTHIAVKSYEQTWKPTHSSGAAVRSTGYKALIFCFIIFYCTAI